MTSSRKLETKHFIYLFLFMLASNPWESLNPQGKMVRNPPENKDKSLNFYWFEYELLLMALETTIYLNTKKDS